MSIATAAFAPAQTQVPEQPQVTRADYDTLIERRLMFPVPSVDPATVRDTFDEGRGGGRKHEATDITAPAGTPVVAVDDGTIKKLFFSVRGGLTVYLFDRTGTYCYYYAHLQRYASMLAEGESVQRGDLLAYVGSSGDAAPNDPHLHFAIFKLGPHKDWWQGTPVNPYPILMRTQSR